MFLTWESPVFTMRPILVSNSRGSRAVAPGVLLKAIDFDGVALDLRKFNPDQPRVPAGNGRESGRWGSGGNSVTIATDPTEDHNDSPRVSGRSSAHTSFESLIQPVLYDSKAHERSKTEDLEYEERRHLGTTTPEDDVAHGNPIPIAPQMVIPFAVAPPRAEEGSGQRPPANSSPSNDDDKGPELCPAPVLDRGRGRKDFDLLYQQYVGTVVNPHRDPPLSPYLGYRLPNPNGGEQIYFDHCRDSDGAVIDAKGYYEEFLSKPFGRVRLAEDWAKQASNQIAAAQAAGNRQVEWWFYEQSSANFAKEVFEKAGISDRIIIRQLDYPGDARWPYPASAPWAKGRQR